MEDGFPKLPGGIYTQNIIGMTLIGLMMVGLAHTFGHSYVDGVGYGVIQSILDKDMTATNLLVLLFALKLLATTISLGCGASAAFFRPRSISAQRLAQPSRLSPLSSCPTLA